jgi:CheY-like chemotaxis protein
VKILTSLGYQVLIAEDGQEAIEQVVKHEHTISAILMDQSMPRKDGLTATREIRAMEQAGKLSRRRLIIAVTAVVSLQARALCTEAGTDEFLAKPLSMDKLRQTLATHLSLRSKK